MTIVTLAVAALNITVARETLIVTKANQPSCGEDESSCDKSEPSFDKVNLAVTK